ncbi:MAG TPA: LysM peptidoglycan-binding domain-containing protein [Clostridia bacterium]|nr:LysM peptidoglycan-binding domain-containing protein [Clostridiaceae bacterium]HOA30543.1 LysM peptidoglycan-binding domain-containing protein [Clostridia bacterium]HPZ51316.1 LysM peptidoglycan-binding domain-containing protein [Clostridia bacterium]
MRSLIAECRDPEEMLSLLRKRRIERKRRTIRLRVVAFVFIVTSLLLVVTVCAKSIKTKPQTTYKTVVVEQGDTLWDLAKEYYPDMEIRRAVYELKKINNLQDATIYEGQSLKVPDIDND